MEGEMNNLMKVSLSVFMSLCYCYAISKLVPKGKTRLLCVFPIVCLYLFLPLNLSSVHFRGIIGFFIGWLANFKLLLFAFGNGPLCSDPSISLKHFVTIACFPIKIQQNPLSKHPRQSKPFVLKSDLFKENPPAKPKNSQIETIPSSPISYVNAIKSHLHYVVKGLLLGILIRVYDYSEYIHPNVMWLFYCFHIYILLELILAIVATLARALLGLELEPQFNEPLLSTSLQDFWGRRWNLMVTTILRPTVYEPSLQYMMQLVGRKWAPLPAVFATFVVSALMHEIILYYMGRVKPTFRMTWFFLIHGFCLTVEIALKKGVKTRWRLPRLISGPLTVGFVMVTCFWVFIPEFQRCKVDAMAFEEYAAFGALVNNIFLLIRSLFSEV
ncbi:acyl-CoA--sterol O-acyltransferase 1 [Quillaja saponaria]|uniref:Acyl-CoA--sterol O-acyltransferase 1 n=1 Tax=Quillaja saponaria TaxID=32244 RepID=A0AAD7QIT5_QUISA|nr:acyl-CoA--sterol O-acyltransferase 1 [Quillaja saponaria]